MRKAHDLLRTARLNELKELLRIEILMPRQAAGGRAIDSLQAIYAAGTMDEVIPFALPIRWYPDCPEGKRDFECHDGKVLLKYGSLDPDGVGYVYKVKADSFEKIDEWQWVSRESCIPVEVAEIRVADYLDRVEFSPEAEEIRERLWGNRFCRSDEGAFCGS